MSAGGATLSCSFLHAKAATAAAAAVEMGSECYAGELALHSFGTEPDS